MDSESICRSATAEGIARFRTRSLIDADRWIRTNGIADFETLSEVVERQGRMIQMFRQFGCERHVLSFAHCDAWCSDSCVSDACHYGTRRLRLMTIKSSTEILRAQQGQKHFVSLLHPAWSRNVGNLATLSPEPIRKAVQQQLRRAGVTVAVGGFELCLNRQLDGSLYWSGGVHVVCAGVDKKQLRKAFSVKPWRECARPVDIRSARNLGRLLGYALKRLPQERREYVARNGRKNRRKLPLDPQHLFEHDSWLAEIPPGGRMILVGLRRTADGTVRPI